MAEEVAMATMIELAPIDMTSSVMQDLERRGLIIRLAPRRHELPAAPGQTLWEPIYDSSEELGPHRLITVSVNKTRLDEFGTHVDNEEFLLIGDTSMKPLYLVIALCPKEELADKVARAALSPDDFVCLQVKYNDPETSFFTMLADVPHGEAVGEADGRPATFYVTEPRDLGTEITDLGDYEVRIREDAVS
jgi:hypothetical protein